jgi:microcystin-dependent protein
MFAGNFAPTGWAFCSGQQMRISENPDLFNLIGTTYGGDGQNVFNLPDLRGRVPRHRGNGTSIGQQDGVETVTLTTQQLPVHTHPLVGSAVLGDQVTPSANVSANTPQGFNIYVNGAPDGDMNAAAITAAGGSQPHDNRQPYLAISFIIALYGIYPSQI